MKSACFFTSGITFFTSSQFSGADEPGTAVVEKQDSLMSWDSPRVLISIIPKYVHFFHNTTHDRLGK